LWERGDLTAGAVALPAQARTLSTAAPGGDVPRTGAVASPGPQYRDDDIAGDPGAGAAGGGLRRAARVGAAARRSARGRAAATRFGRGESGRRDLRGGRRVCA